MIFSLPSCKKEAAETQGNSNLAAPFQGKSFKAILPDIDLNKYNQLVADNEARLALIEDQASRGSKNSITVPTDYATIQEAVDAASEGANIFVNAGTYTEDVVISTAGLKLQARNGVLLIGSLTLFEGADNVTIKKFNIQNENTAIHGFGVTGGQVVQNTITSVSGLEGIHYQSCDGVTIRDNSITGPELGIFFNSVSVQGNGTANNNTVLNNTLSGNSFAGIYFQGSCQNNTVVNNTVSEGSEFSNGGISLFGVPDFLGAPLELLGECKNNIIKNNNCTQHFAGISLIYTANNNTIGPNNTTNENNSFGIVLYGGASDNNIFNNTALNNVNCDIVVWDDGVPSQNNTFSNNTYDCFQEL
jgi:parallel beta-helix repeat protein